MAIYGLPYTDHELLVLQNLSIPGWIALALMPKSKLAQKFAVFMAVMAGLVYVAIFATMAVEGKLEDFSLEAFQSLDGLMKAFSKSDMMLLGWMHYVCFDLMVGSWICVDATTRGVPYLLLLPCLFFTLMLGPCGLLMYVILRLPFSGGAKTKAE
eukprot:jgi/Tetstr1/434489/TSEL_023581.t1